MIYAFKNKSIDNSSSGAAYPTIVEALFQNIISSKGFNDSAEQSDFIVYGAAFNDDFSVSHQRANNIKECEKFRGSKYVQSNLGDSFRQVKKDLLKGKSVLFTGTPCQVNAIKIYLKEVDTSNLYLIDIICHGTPPEAIWLDFIEWLENKYKSKLVKFSFRYQNAKWKQYPIMAEFENGTRVVNSYSLRVYIKLFFTNMIMKEGCYSCKFANLRRPGDLTLGDFWGIELVMPEFPFKNDVSEILVNTSKGKGVIDMIQELAKSNSDIVMKECNSKEYIKYQHNLRHPTSKPEQTTQFWDEYKEKGIDFIIKKYTGYSLIGMLKHCIIRFLNEHSLKKIIQILKSIN